MRGPPSPGDRSGHLGASTSATRRGEFPLARYSPRRPSPLASCRRPPQARLGTGTAARRGAAVFHSRSTASASGEYCVSRRGAGVRGGGRREAVLRRLRARHSGTRSREGRCCAAATRVPEPAPAGRLLTPRPYARRARQPPGAQPQLPPPASGPEDVCRPGDVSASGVAWLPRRSPVPLPLVSPGETDAVTAGLGCDLAAGIPPSRHTSPSLRHAFVPPCQPRRMPPHSGPHAPDMAAEDGDRVGQSCGQCLREAPEVVPNSDKRQNVDRSDVVTSTETE